MFFIIHLWLYLIVNNHFICIYFIFKINNLNRYPNPLELWFVFLVGINCVVQHLSWAGKTLIKNLDVIEPEASSLLMWKLPWTTSCASPVHFTSQYSGLPKSILFCLPLQCGVTEFQKILKYRRKGRNRLQRRLKQWKECFVLTRTGD